VVTIRPRTADLPTPGEPVTTGGPLDKATPSMPDDVFLLCNSPLWLIHPRDSRQDRAESGLGGLLLRAGRLV
jgi:hypothetical protein